MTIKRYDSNDGCEIADDGPYVLHSDHEAEVARLRAEVEKVLGYEVAPLEEKVAERRAEVEGLKQVKEIVAKTRRSNSDAYEQACRNDDGLMQAVCNARTSLLNNIDAAMGASA
ncbi:hypothetical protein [Stenotrophomonas sp. ATs4]|uniref:hypothetical protein n=1 Tax=Stenotrophomonas sp. ATs4 TaxID=3402766 RepID=UPI003F72DBC3